jgi:glycosyltransferase involved in cell wall biosynthesis
MNPYQTPLALPTISIVTPSLNQAEYIEQTICSVLDQSYPGLQYIVLDGGSTDGTIEILKKYSKHLTWISEKDGGQSAALNKGLKMVTGEIFGFINSDDYYEPGAFFKTGRFFSTHPQASWLSGKCRIVNSRGHEIRKAIAAYKNIWLLLKSYNALLVIDYISQPSTFWRRSIFDSIGGFDEKLHFSMDYDLSLRVGREHPLYTINETLAAFRIHQASKSGLIRSHFGTDLTIAQRYIKSPIIIKLHHIHNQLIIFFYEHIL